MWSLVTSNTDEEEEPRSYIVGRNKLVKPFWGDNLAISIKILNAPDLCPEILVLGFYSREILTHIYKDAYCSMSLIV